MTGELAQIQESITIWVPEHTSLFLQLILMERQQILPFRFQVVQSVS